MELEHRGQLLDAVVVNYRTPDDLEGFLQSWSDHSFPGVHKLTVVNVSPTPEDARVASLRHKYGDDIGYVEFGENVGYAKACNRGALYGGAPLLALFNADTRITPGVLDHCCSALLSRCDWGILGPRQVDDYGRLTHTGIFGTPEHPRFRTWLTKDTGKYNDVEEALTVSGSAYFVKREVWRELTMCPKYREMAPTAEGAFLPTQHYYEETYCSYHAREHDWKVIYYGPACMVHRWHKASPVGKSGAEKYFDESKEYFRRACAHHGMRHE